MRSRKLLDTTYITVGMACAIASLGAAGSVLLEKFDRSQAINELVRTGDVWQWFKRVFFEPAPLSHWATQMVLVAAVYSVHVFAKSFSSIISEIKNLAKTRGDKIVFYRTDLRIPVAGEEDFHVNLSEPDDVANVLRQVEKALKH